VLFLSDSKCQNGGRPVQCADTRTHLSTKISLLSTNLGQPRTNQFWYQRCLYVCREPSLPGNKIINTPDHCLGPDQIQGVKTETPKEMNPGARKRITAYHGGRNQNCIEGQRTS
jgi:hypothetical protein